VDGQPYVWHSEGQGFESPRVHQIFQYEIAPCGLAGCLSSRRDGVPRSRQEIPYAWGWSVFQRLDDAVGFIGTLLNHDLTRTLDCPDWSALRLAFATRHVLTHNFGLADATASRSSASPTSNDRLTCTHLRGRLSLDATA
jgi:hypothetical protein